VGVGRGGEGPRKQAAAGQRAAGTRPGALKAAGGKRDEKKGRGESRVREIDKGRFHVKSTLSSEDN